MIQENAEILEKVSAYLFYLSLTKTAISSKEQSKIEHNMLSVCVDTFELVRNLESCPAEML